MNDEQLESLLRAASESVGLPTAPSRQLVDRVRNAYARRRQRTVRVTFAAALAGCYVAGMATMWIVLAFSESGKAEVAQRSSSPSSSAESSTDALPLSQRQQHDPRQHVEPHKPIQPEFVAEKSRYELLRQVGDDGQRRGDLQTAVTYYGQALDAATDVEKRISYEQDNWLLISLKKDRLASRHAPTQGDSI